MKDTHEVVIKTMLRLIADKKIRYNLKGTDGNAEIIRLLFSHDFLKSELEKTNKELHPAKYISPRDDNAVRDFAFKSYNEFIGDLFENGGREAKATLNRILMTAKLDPSYRRRAYEYDYDKIHMTWDDFITNSYYNITKQFMIKGGGMERGVEQLSEAIDIAAGWTANRG